MFVDGSQVFSYDRPDNTWLMFAYNKYFLAQLNEAGESAIETTQRYDRVDIRPKYIENGNVECELMMQLLEPQFNITVV